MSPKATDSIAHSGRLRPVCLGPSIKAKCMEMFASKCTRRRERQTVHRGLVCSCHTWVCWLVTCAETGDMETSSKPGQVVKEV